MYELIECRKELGDAWKKLSQYQIRIAELEERCELRGREVGEKHATIVAAAAAHALEISNLQTEAANHRFRIQELERRAMDAEAAVVLLREANEALRTSLMLATTQEAFQATPPEAVPAEDPPASP